jgi:methyl-accepting chemotaxis protein
MPFTISRAIYFGVALFAAGLVAVVGVSTFALNKLRVGGGIYNEIVAGKDLLADILPPPLYIIDIYVEVLRIQSEEVSYEEGAANIAARKQYFDERMAYWPGAPIPQNLMEGLRQASQAEVEKFWSELEGHYLPAAKAGDKQAATESLQRLRAIYNSHKAQIDALVLQVNDRLATLDQTVIDENSRYSGFMLGTAGLVLCLLVLTIIGLQRRVLRPMRGMSNFMRELAAENYAAEVPYLQRKDEIGEMAQAVGVFRNAGMERRRLEQDANESRFAMDNERASREAQNEAKRRAAQHAVETLGGGLSRLADGDLAQRIDSELDAETDLLRRDFNAAVEKLQKTLVGIFASAGTIRSGMNEISAASDELARRTEGQAATLEETAAALAVVTETVQKTAQGAGHANKVAATARDDAARSGDIVRRAVAAMAAIQKSSGEISSIISVIDEIAFQTNLLALNAGVEAARAGEAGRGFAVVASEVRGLAQRSAEAAKEIKNLIGTSGTHVSSGVTLVGETGEALQRIAVQVEDISQIVSDIAGAASDQANGLREINAAVGEMDKATQQNAAMVEEATAASGTLLAETGNLARLIGQFKVERAGGRVQTSDMPALQHVA